MSKTHLAQVQDEFIAKLNKEGILHTFEWLHGWFDQVARAAVQDELNRALGDRVDDEQARGLYLADELMNMASNVSNHSTSATANLLRQARVSALARAVNGDVGTFSSGYGSRVHRRKAWEEWSAEQASGQPAAG